MEVGADGQRRSLGAGVWHECFGDLGGCLYVTGVEEEWRVVEALYGGVWERGLLSLTYGSLHNSGFYFVREITSRLEQYQVWKSFADKSCWLYVQPLFHNRSCISTKR